MSSEKPPKKKKSSSHGSRTDLCVSDPGETRRTGLAFAFTLIRQVMYRAFLQTRPLSEYLFSIGESHQIPGFSRTSPGVSTPSAARIITDTYDPVGNRLTKHDNGVMTTYTYDHNDRLSTETPLSGGAGGGFTYTYDNNGNMLSKAGNGEQMNLTYSALNQLVHAEMTTTTGSSTVDYAYDHDGIRMGKTINGTDVFTYVVDKNRPYAQVLEEQRTQGALSATTSYVYGDDLLSRTTDGMTHYYQYDGLGSTRALSDASGTLTDTYSYDAYGMLLNSTGTSVNSYLYRGEQYDSDLSAYYLRARYYQAGIGRFMTTDRLEGAGIEPVTLHQYLYANDNPITFLDPSGKISATNAIVTAGIVLNLAAIAVGTYTEAGQQAYADFGEYIFPDAFILGGNIYGTVTIPPFLYTITSALSLPAVTPTQINLTTGFGLEILFSVTSGQIALFKTFAKGGEIGTNLPMLQVGLEVYRGMVWNLWNAKNYQGPFHSISVNLPKAGRLPAIGGTIFFDALNGFKGSWGVGRSLWSSSNYPKISIGYSHINYKSMVGGKPIDGETEAEIVFAILTSIYVTNTTLRL